MREILQCRRLLSKAISLGMIDSNPHAAVVQPEYIQKLFVFLPSPASNGGH